MIYIKEGTFSTNTNDYRRSRQLLSLTIIFFWASEYCHAPYFTPYLETLGFAATVIGVITGISILTFGIESIIASLVARKLG